MCGVILTNLTRFWTKGLTDGSSIKSGGLGRFCLPNPIKKEYGAASGGESGEVNCKSETKQSHTHTHTHRETHILLHTVKSMASLTLKNDSANAISTPYGNYTHTLLLHINIAR